MPVSIRIDPATGVGIGTCSGRMRPDAAVQSVSDLWKSPSWRGQSAVWDFREAQLDMSSEEVEQVARFVLEHQPTPPPRKVAFVTPRDVDFGVARMFQAHRRDSATEFRVFRIYEEALRWAESVHPAD